MASDRDSEDEALETLEFEDGSEVDDEIDEDILDALEGDLAAEEAASEEDTGDEDSDSGSDDSDSDDDEHPPRPPPPLPLPTQVTAPNVEVSPPAQPVRGPAAPPLAVPPPQSLNNGASSERESSLKTPTPPPTRQRSLSPAGLRKGKLLADLRWPRSFTVEAIAAIPHPVPTHCLASSLCMSHLLTGSDDGYIRDYDIFTSVNGKIFLTAPQRHHCGVMEGQMKAVPIRCWWENPADMRGFSGPIEEPPLCAAYSMLMHSDALWCLAGTDQGHVNLFTVRHDPGRLCYVMHGHRGPVSALTMQHDEKGFFSAGWDGEALQWDLNSGQIVRNFTSHGAQLAAIAVRPLASDFVGTPWVGLPRRTSTSILPPNGVKREDVQMSSVDASISEVKKEKEEDGDSVASDYDPLFDDEPDVESSQNQQQGQVPPPVTPVLPQQQPQRAAIAPKNAPPILDPVSYTAFSPDVLMTASIDGQVILWDRRAHTPARGVGRLWMGEKTPPWCMSACWSADGGQIYAGRRNGTVDVWDVRQTGQAHMGTPRTLKTLRNPVSSGVVSCVVAFPDGKHIACASNDNIRLWNVAEAGEPDTFGKMKSGVQFKIIPGHHGGFISQMLVDRAARFLVSASSNRGWHGESTRTVFVHEIKNVW